MDALTRRAERALLGAMIADPSLLRLMQVRPEEFADPRHGDWYRGILAAARSGQFFPGAWRKAILAASPSLAPADLDELVADCPHPSHGLAYANIVVQAWSRRFLQEAAQQAGDRAEDVGREHRGLPMGDIRAGVNAANVAAGHRAKVASAIQDHASRGSSGTRVGTGSADGASVVRARREELVLAGLLGQAPQRAAEILKIVTAAAFSDPHRRKAFEIVSGMHQRGRPVDALTVDWELAMHGVPITAGPGGRHGETYGTHLARVHVSRYGAPIDAAREVQAQYEQPQRPRLVRGGLPGTPGQQRVRGHATAPAEQRHPRLRLIERPPEAEGPTRGPELR